MPTSAQTAEELLASLSASILCVRPPRHGPKHQSNCLFRLSELAVLNLSRLRRLSRRGKPRSIIAGTASPCKLSVGPRQGDSEAVTCNLGRSRFSMLPLPASFSRTHPRRPGYSLGVSLTGRRAHYRSTRDVLLSRARVTNLGFFLLAAFAALSFLLNVFHYFTDPSDGSSYEGRLGGVHSVNAAPRGIWETLQRDRTLREIDHLIMVPGHAIWTGRSVEERMDEGAWVLESYQRGGGRIAAFFRHIAGGYVSSS